MTTEQVRNAWNRNGVAAYCGLAALCFTCFGYSLCSFVNREVVVTLTAQFNAERRADQEVYETDKRYLRKSLRESKMAILDLAKASSKGQISATETAKAAIESKDK